jgi:hypothetical protein
VTDLKLLDVIALYREVFRSQGVRGGEYPHDAPLPLFFRRSPALAHLEQMLPKMEEFVATGHIDKAFRWLGFIQGALWVLRVYTLEELKNHSRPAS